MALTVDYQIQATFLPWNDDAARRQNDQKNRLSHPLLSALLALLVSDAMPPVPAMCACSSLWRNDGEQEPSA